MWRNRNVWLIMAGEAVAGLGMWVGIIGNLEFLQHTVQSDTLKSLIILCNTYVGLFLGPYAGRLIDASRKKTIINLSGLLRIVSVLFMFGAIATGNVWWMVVYLLLLGTSATFFFPAWQAIIPMVVPAKELLQVNSLYMTVSTLTRVLGTAFGGLLLLYMSLNMMYLCTIISYTVLFLITLLLRLDEKPAAEAVEADSAKASAASLPSGATTGPKAPKQRPRGGFMELWPMLKQSPNVLAALLLTFVPALFLGGFNLVILKVSEIQADTSIKAWLYTAEGLCFLLGSFLVKRFGSERRRMAVLLGCTFIFASAHAALILASVKLLSVVAFGAFGLAAGIFFPITTTLFQKEVAPEMHGRFFSLRGMLDRLLFQVVLVATGILLDAVGFQAMETILAVCSLSLAGYYTAKRLRGSKPAERPAAEA
ncbi:MFS transporter [Gorillibacterium sp. sgz5001074]|uniref:MFS transporter n=1 Tax=Gorillibacterium sp. sgz5001074 TaxID=3446695 RepID=UPI003F6782D6